MFQKNIYKYLCFFKIKIACVLTKSNCEIMHMRFSVTDNIIARNIGQARTCTGAYKVQYSSTTMLLRRQ